MANVEQGQQMIPLITCEVSLDQYVCELVFGVDVFDLIWLLESRWIRSNNQSRATLWVLVDEKIGRLREHHQYDSKRWSFREIFDLCQKSELCFQRLNQSDPTNRERESRLISSKKRDFGFCWKVWNWSLFLTHPQLIGINAWLPKTHRTIWEHTVSQFSNRFYFFFFEVVVIDPWSRYFVELLRRLVANSQYRSTHFCVWPSLS